MQCPLCGKEDPLNREMCPSCGAPVKPIPIPPLGKLKFGKYDWYILEKQNGKLLLLTEKVIENRPYHREECAVTWETCDMRKYLNGEFYYSFVLSDRARIAETRVVTSNNPWYGTCGGNPTEDHIFLLSIEEVVRYFGDSGCLKNRFMYPNCDWCKDGFLPWIDDQYSINRRAVDDAGIVRFWRLRSPGGNSRSTAGVGGFVGDGFDHGEINIGNADRLVDGHFLQDGCGWLSQEDENHMLNGVRPALWLEQSDCNCNWKKHDLP